MKGNGWMQRVLYFLMLMLGIYIVYKGGRLFMKQPAVQTVLDGGDVQRMLENTAARTWTGGYTAVIEGKDRNWGGSWFQAALPVYSYLAEHGERETEESEISRGEENVAAAEEKEGEHTGRADRGEQTEEENLQAARSEAEKETNIETDTGSEAENDKEGNREKQSEYSLEEHEEDTDLDAVEDESTVSDEMADGNAKFGINADSDIDAENSSETETEASSESEQAQEAFGRSISPGLLSQLSDFSYLVNEYFTVDGGTTADADLLDADAFLSEDLSIVKNPAVPQILIYHTHSQEKFVDSVEGDIGTTIVGMGDVLAAALEKKGYQVIHDTGVYDLVDGVLDRSAAYDYARQAVEELLTQYPTIQVVIDLHRDGVDGQKFVTEIEGKPCSMVMFFNGISRNQEGEISYLPNPYVKQNLAFSFQMELAARQQYPGFTRNIYLKAERFNLHLRPRSVLIEAGTQLNTVEEERNAMEILANLLDEVLQEP